MEYAYCFAGLNVQQFMKQYRETFPLATITPKLHMLEEHIATWMDSWHFCPGIHGEQGGEAIHAIFNDLERTYASIRNPTEQIRSMLREHQIQVSPSTDILRPVPPKKKKL